MKPARIARALALLAVATTSLVAISAVPPPASAEPKPLSLALAPGGGQLVIRDSEAPTAIEAATFTGTVDDSTGALAATFSTPVLSFELPVEDLDTTAYVDATFTETAPGVTTGAVTLIDGDPTQANVSVSTTLRVDLHIEVGNPAFVTADCTTSPIALGLTSMAPYDSDVGEVTLVDPDFSVPAVAVSPTCPDFIVPRVNESLAGGGHSISLGLEGTIPLPTVGTEDTLTTLAVDPTPSSRRTDAVELTATVVPAPGEQEGIPTGQVEFSDGAAILGAAPVDGAGQAVFTTDSLAVGDHQLVARYVGDEVYRPSLSAAVPHLVAADPTLTLAMADTVLYGGTARAVTIDVANPTQFGRAIANGRVDITLRRDETTNFFNADAVRLEWRNGDTWERVPLTYDIGTRIATGSIGPVGGQPIAAGASLRHNLRISMPDPIDAPPPTTCSTSTAPCIGDWELTAGLVEVAPGDGAVTDELVEVDHPFILVETTRRTTTLAVVGGAPRPHTVREGYTVDLAVSVGPSLGGASPTGLFELYVDGQSTLVRSPTSPYADGYTRQIPTGTGTVVLQFPADDLDPGRHQLTARYLGDALFAPAEITTSFTVLAPTGHPFVCQTPTQNANNWYGVGMTFDADVPEVATSGATLELPVAAAGWTMNRPGVINPFPALPNNSTATVGEGSLLDGVMFGLGPDGSGTAQSANRTFGTPMAGSPNPADVSQVDQKITFGGSVASVTVEGEPGDVVPVTLDQVVMAMHISGSIPIPTVSTCTPDGDPMPLGEVEIAGTTVTATPDSAREITDEVELAAETFPADAAGSVSFSSDIDGVLGEVTVDGGTATLSTDELSPGTHVITASFNATDAEVPDTQGTVTVEVQYSPRSGVEAFVVAARTDFTGAADEDDVVADGEDLDGGLSKAAYLGSLVRSDEYLTHVVNEMYLDTLGREGDESGVAFWVDKLRSGYPIAKVAASFYASAEYYARVGGTDEAWVRDLYETLLGREAEAGGLTYWVGEIPKRGRGGVALAFYQEPESLAFRVTNLYEFLLGRAPSASDIAYWSPIVKKRGDLALAVFLAASEEYADRAEERFPIID